MATEALKLTTARKNTGDHDLARTQMATVRDTLGQPPFTNPSYLLTLGTHRETAKRRIEGREATIAEATTTVTDPSTNEQIVFKESRQFSEGIGMNGSWHITYWSEIRTHTINPDGTIKDVAVIKERPRLDVVTYPPMTEEPNGPLDIFDANLARAEDILEGNSAPADVRKID